MAGARANMRNKTEEEIIQEQEKQRALESKIAEKASTPKEKKDYLNYCALCNEKLTAFVAANGLRFCNDTHAEEHFKV